MDRAGGRAPSLSKDEWQILFQLIADGEDRGAARNKLKHRDPATIKRAYNVAATLHIRGKQSLDDSEAEAIALQAKYLITAGFVKNAFVQYLAWRKRRSTIELLRKRHLKRLIAEVGMLRSCLTDPQLEWVPAIRKEPLIIRGQDWRLDPITWVRLCTPDLTDQDKWGPLFPSLKAHMKESPFWRHYLELRKTAHDLDKAYEEAARELAKGDDEFSKSWDKIQNEKLLMAKPSRVPDFPEPEWGECRPCYEQEDCSNILRRFAKIIPDVHNRLSALENQLEQLNKDLLSHEVEPIIARGHCDNCP